MKTLVFDVMLDEMFIRTLEYKFRPGVTLDGDAIVEYVKRKLPTLRNKKFNIVFDKVK